MLINESYHILSFQLLCKFTDELPFINKQTETKSQFSLSFFKFLMYFSTCNQLFLVAAANLENKQSSNKGYCKTKRYPKKLQASL